MSGMMKDSGIEWVGDIPTSWILIPTKRVFQGRKRIVGDDSSKYERLALTMQGVIKRDKEDNEGLQPEKFDGYQIIQSNEIVFKLIDLENEKTSRVGLSPYTGIVSPAYIIIANTQDDNRFYYYWFLDLYYRLIFNKMGDDGVRSALNLKDVLNIPIPHIPTNEQRAIADFLDKECGIIDELISLQEKFIDSLKSYKQSVINEAVTKGLNPNVTMKDCDIDWLKRIPKHWQPLTPKALFSLRKEKAMDGERQLTASQQHGIVYQDEYTALTGNRVVTVLKDFDILKHVEEGDFVISMRSFQGGLEYSTKTGSISSAYVMLIPNLKYVYPRYYRWLFKSVGYINALQSTSNMVRDGQAMRYSNFTQVGLFQVPIEEQQAIADYLDKKCAEIDSLIALKQSKIEQLKEYKKSLIYEYVTGKKEVI